jgi:hypothetical protein
MGTDYFHDSRRLAIVFDLLPGTLFLSIGVTALVDHAPGPGKPKLPRMGKLTAVAGVERKR